MKSRIPAAGAAALLAFGALCVSAPRAQAQAAVDQAPSTADGAFMSGMIDHHAQAVLMAGWASSHGAGPAVRELCERIAVSQRDEIAAMARWLRERRRPVPDADTLASRRMVGMDGSMAGTGASMPAMAGMDRATLMPGMLTAAQLTQLDSARGPRFDRLFLTFMIQHHAGALTMVEQLLNTPGAAQDGFVFQFASDVNADQSAEIARMRRMLAALPSDPRSP